MSMRSIRRAIRERKYTFTSHALEEMDEDDLTHDDVCEALLHGKQVGVLTDDPRGLRFVVRGAIQDQAIEIEVVTRFLPSGLLRIITAYVIEE
jgi:Domain of unknown function (DUF4258)